MKIQFSAADFTLGILGGGQLGRMLLQKSADFNITTAVMDADNNAPSKNLCNQFINKSFNDFDAVYDFGKQVDLLTIEIEHVNTEALMLLEKEGLKIFPQPAVIHLVQDKGLQKEFYSKNGIPTANFKLVTGKAELNSMDLKFPFILKLRKGGYDGKGVMKITSLNQLADAFDEPCIVEDCVDFKKEISIIVARNFSGEVKCYPSCEMIFNPDANLVELLFAPAHISKQLEEKAQIIATDLITKLNLCGILAVEMFVTNKDELLVNEIAPRPHNSGHHTIEANSTSQYEQHLRAILNLPLGHTAILKTSAMINLLGEGGYEGEAIYENLEEAMKLNGVHIHLYGKKFTRPFRKMGHITVTGETPAEVMETAKKIQTLVKVKGSQPINQSVR
jgi:5-(carboxyamino)imidazole ribonucleotide synthase